MSWPASPAIQNPCLRLRCQKAWQEAAVHTPPHTHLKKYNLFDCSCLHTEPSETSFQKAIAFSFLYKSSLPNDEACEDNTTVSILCKKNPAGFFRYLTESGFKIEKCRNGIYHVHIEMPIQVFITILQELDSKDCFLVDSLLKRASGECSEALIFPECIFHVAEY